MKKYDYYYVSYPVNGHIYYAILKNHGSKLSYNDRYRLHRNGGWTHIRTSAPLEDVYPFKTLREALGALRKTVPKSTPCQPW